MRGDMFNFFFKYVVPALAKLFWLIVALAFIVAVGLRLIAYVQALAGK